MCKYSMIFFLLSGIFISLFANNINTEDSTSFYFLPVLGYRPNTSWMAGGACSYIQHHPSYQRSSTYAAQFLYSLKHQMKLVARGKLYPERDIYHYFRAEYKIFPDKFYGYGSDSKKENEVKNTTTGYKLQYHYARKFLNYNTRLGFLGVIGSYRRNEIDDEKLALFEQLLSEENKKYLTYGLGHMGFYDTRDNNLMPRNGLYFHWEYVNYFKNTFDYYFQTLKLDYRQYYPLQNYTYSVLAWQLYFSYATQDAPLDMVPTLGGDKLLRGYTSGRYRDRCLLGGQIEYRRAIIPRLGAVLFMGVGNVFSRLDSIMKQGNTKMAAGMGLRWQVIPQGINFRIDGAINRDGKFKFVIAALEAF